MTEAVLALSRPAKRLIALACDVVLCLFTVACAYALRLDGWVFPTGHQWFSYIAAILFALPLFISFGLYRAIFRYAGWGALVATVHACAIYALIYTAAFTLWGVDTVPRTIGIIQPILLFVAVGTSRAVTRYWLGGGYLLLTKLRRRRRVLVYGAGSAGRQLAAALANSDEMALVGFVDDDFTLQGSVLNGQKIYSPVNLPKLIEELEVADLLLAIPSASRRRRNQILERVRSTATTLRTLPGLADLAQGRVTVNDLRELDIDDLLGRDAVSPNQLLLAKNIAGKTVLLTGAGGSIGSELCRQALQLRPKTIILVESGEYNLYNIYHELLRVREIEDQSATEIVPLLGSVQDEARMACVLSAFSPDTIYHAAAYKHVPLVEQNPSEGVRNNVFGTLVMARLARAHGVRDFVLISTDKAVRPTNIMGTTKRLAELILQALAAEPGNTRFSMVRFGNVLGSSGSVVPLFREQIRAGGPITITHEDITRYFMTIPEAAQLVIQAGAMAAGGEVFVLDMEAPVRIVDLARRMVELSGLTVRDAAHPDGDISIEIVGLRPGEKLFEELLIGNNPEPTPHPRILKANESYVSFSFLQKELAKLRSATDANDVELIRAQLHQLIEEYVPGTPMVDWVQLQNLERTAAQSRI